MAPRSAKWPFDTIFARMAVFATLVLFLVQIGWFAVLTIQRPRNEADGYSRGLLVVIQAAQSDIERGTTLSPVLGVELIPVTRHIDTLLGPPDRGPMTHLLERIREGLPPGTKVMVEHHPRLALWVAYPGSPSWIVMTLNPPPTPPILLETIAMLLAAVLLSVGAAWQMQRPMARVAQLALRFGEGERPPPMREKGPREVRELIHAVNQMMSQISKGED